MHSYGNMRYYYWNHGRYHDHGHDLAPNPLPPWLWQAVFRHTLWRSWVTGSETETNSQARSSSRWRWIRRLWGRVPAVRHSWVVSHDNRMSHEWGGSQKTGTTLPPENPTLIITACRKQMRCLALCACVRVRTYVCLCVCVCMYVCVCECECMSVFQSVWFNWFANWSFSFSLTFSPSLSFSSMRVWEKHLTVAQISQYWTNVFFRLSILHTVCWNNPQSLPQEDRFLTVTR